MSIEETIAVLGAGGTMGGPMARNLTRSGFSVHAWNLAAKDAALVEDAARPYDLDLPLIATIRSRLEAGASEHGDEDMAATFLTAS